MINKINLMNCLDGLPLIEPKSVHVCVSSPPYYALRDYGIEPTKWPAITYSLFGRKIRIKAQTACLGLETDIYAYIGHMVHIYRLVRECLRDDGTVWLNIGDSYAANQKTGKNIKPKDMMGVPWMLAFALREDGWFLRQDIIWSKPNPMPESVTDRCTKAHEYIFMLSKSNRYYYDYEAIKRPAAESSIARLNQDIENQKGSERVPGKVNGNMKAVGKIDKQRGHSRRHAGFNERWDNMTVKEQCEMCANKRSVWEVATQPFKEAHFATFPQELISDCIKAGSPVDGIVLDMFMGSGTTALVASKLNRNYIGFEQSEKYVKIAQRRLAKELGLFNPENIPNTIEMGGAA